jgi:hypothetical protein
MGPQIAAIWRYDKRHQGRLKLGDAAPDVVLTSLEGPTAIPLRRCIGARPLILIFGSYT